jgi:hypothetical protein
MVDQPAARPCVRPAFEPTGTQRKYGVASAANIKKSSDDQTTGLAWNPGVPMSPSGRLDAEGLPQPWHENTNGRNRYAVIVPQNHSSAVRKHGLAMFIVLHTLHFVFVKPSCLHRERPSQGWTHNKSPIFNHSAVCLTTGPQSFQKPVLHRVRSSASFNLQYPLVSWRSSSSCCILYLVFPSLLSSFVNVLQKAALTPDVTKPVSFPYSLLSSLTLRHSFSFLTRSARMIFSVLLQHHISKLPKYCWFTFPRVADILVFKSIMRYMDIQEDFGTHIHHRRLKLYTDVKFCWGLPKQGSRLASAGILGPRYLGLCVLVYVVRHRSQTKAERSHCSLSRSRPYQDTGADIGTSGTVSFECEFQWQICLVVT